jgi:hypothetical protein
LIAGGLTGTLGVKTAKGLQVRFAGRARSLTIVEGGAARDLRPTMFAVLLQNPAAMVIPLALLLVGSWLSARRSWSWKESLS